MNTEKVQQIITEEIEKFQKRIRYARQYAPSKTQIATLTELGIIDLMPKNFGHGDAKVVIAEATRGASAVMNAYGEGEEIGASDLYKAMNEVEETTVKRNQIRVGMQVRIKNHARYDWQAAGYHATLVTPVEHRIYGGQTATIHAIYVDEMEDENMNPVYEYTVALDDFGLFDLSEIELINV
jgi:hypothetical protein